MSSRHHTPGISQSPRDIGNRGLRGVLGHQQQRTADIREALYIKPLGRQQHLVRNIGDNAQAYRVGSNLPGLTFKPGEVVQLSSNTGHPGENIISVAPPGKKGRLPGFQGSGSVTFTEPTLSNSAPSIAGNMFAFVGTGAGGDLHCYEVNSSGGYVADVGSVTVPSGVNTTGIRAAQRIVYSDPDGVFGSPTLMWTNKLANSLTDQYILIWDIAQDTFTTISLTPPSGSTNFTVGTPWLRPASDDNVYFAVHHSTGAGTLNTYLWSAPKLGGSATELGPYIAFAGSGTALSTPSYFDSDLSLNGTAYAGDDYGIDYAGSNFVYTTAGAGPSGWTHFYPLTSTSGVVIKSGASNAAYLHEYDAGTSTGTGTLDWDATGEVSHTGSASGSMNRAKTAAAFVPSFVDATNFIIRVWDPGSGTSSTADAITINPHPTHGQAEFVHLADFTPTTF